ncbi:MAG: transcriptional repressor [Chlorobium sp.]|jgi:Fur family ferric uptake transcriptional regulator|uniref:Fur family transcriptional regulator n=1 Tax=Chlorobium sp. TaxID=1095 RepID=UPI001D69D004|nr:Fur family transcriptional regulator [Chlorobium sp.]MBN1278677.1 transcriptional repressor [Chlorobiaceae bacterium]MCF8216678.1 transcriptional repressor [Chlorobium sp.]MCF8270861.1 transcriptional repressor [Chlorobium sp.]MCF8287205.1 transcriptional repressor [Chlorobium sp.]MCF8290862.1 transcriptional repressor [Chlorobium sp.]
MPHSDEVIRAAGLKVTPVRRAIVALFAESLRPLTPRDVHVRLLEQFSRSGLPGVYRNLETLAERGILFRIAGFGQVRRYALCPKPGSGHQHHIICVACGRIDRIDECLYHDGMMVGGYRLLSHTMQFEGVCASCLSETNNGQS